MSEGHRVLASGLKGGVKYRVRYIGHPGGDIAEIGNRVLRYRYIIPTRLPAMPMAHSFIDDTDPAARYIIPSLLASGPFDVDSRYSFTEIYEGPMASGYGPNTPIPAFAPPRTITRVAPPRTNGPVGGRRRRRRTQKKSRKSHRRNRK